MLDADQWPRVLASVTGRIVRGTERVSATRLLDALDVGPDPALRQKVGKRLVSAMRRAGWSGPKPMRIPGENGHAAGANGYWRVPSRSRQPGQKRSAGMCRRLGNRPTTPTRPRRASPQDRRDLYIGPIATPGGRQLSRHHLGDVRFSSVSDRIAASRRFAALCHKQTYAVQQNSIASEL